MNAPLPVVTLDDAGQEAPRDGGRCGEGPIPVVFASGPGPLAGFLHAAKASPARPSGVVLCPAIGYDSMLSHRTYRHIAERLSEIGFHVLRFDYHGTGDSAGSPNEPARVAAWLDSIDAAIEHLQALAGLREVSLFGLRMGAVLAAASANRRLDVTSLVLWAPSATGRAYVRELRAFSGVKGDPPAADRAPAKKDEVVAGYFFGADTLADMAKLDLLAMNLASVSRVLLLGRDDLPGAEQRLADHWAAKGVKAENVLRPGYAGMMRDAEFSTVPDAVIGHVVDWLAASPKGPTSTPPCLERKAPAPDVLVASSRDQTRVDEHARFYDEAGRLFGILTQPPLPRGRRSRTAILFLNVGSNHHVGPHRMYVTLARELAARGFSAFRLDVGGLGDSRPLPGGKENVLYAKQSILDIERAMTYLGQTIDAERFVLFGICAGSYLAFHATVMDRRVSGQILVNPQTFEWRDGDSLNLRKKKGYKATRFYRQALFQRDTWVRLWRREINLRGIAAELYVRTRQKLAIRVIRVLSPSDLHVRHVDRAFSAISDRGTESVLIYSGSDGGIDVIERYLGIGARRMRKRPNFRFQIIDGADHTITPPKSQEQLEKLLVGYMCDVFG